MKKGQTLINLLSSILGYARNITTTWSKGGKSDILNVHCDPFFNKISFFIIYVINWYYYTMNCITNQVFFFAFTAFVQCFYNSLHICKGKRLLAIYYVKFLKVFSLRSPGYFFHLFLDILYWFQKALLFLCRDPVPGKWVCRFRCLLLLQRLYRAYMRFAVLLRNCRIKW